MNFEKKTTPANARPDASTLGPNASSDAACVQTTTKRTKEAGKASLNAPLYLVSVPGEDADESELRHDENVARPARAFGEDVAARSADANGNAIEIRPWRQRGVADASALVFTGQFVMKVFARVAKRGADAPDARLLDSTCASDALDVLDATGAFAGQGPRVRGEGTHTHDEGHPVIDAEPRSASRRDARENLCRRRGTRFGGFGGRKARRRKKSSRRPVVTRNLPTASPTTPSSVRRARRSSPLTRRRQSPRASP